MSPNKLMKQYLIDLTGATTINEVLNVFSNVLDFPDYEKNIDWNHSWDAFYDDFRAAIMENETEVYMKIKNIYPSKL